MRKGRDRPHEAEMRRGIRRFVASNLLLLADAILVLVLCVVTLRSDRTSPVILLLFVAALAVAYADLYRREERWQGRVSDLELKMHHAVAEGDTLAEISREFSGEVETDALFDLIARRARELLGADYAAVTIVDDTTGDPVLVAAIGLTPGVRWRSPGERGKGLAGKAIATGQPVVVEDFGTNPAFPVSENPRHKAEKMVAALVMPVLRGTKTLGALTVGYRKAHSFNDAELASMEALASQAGVALENSMLYGEERRRVAELEAVLDQMSEGVIVTDRAGKVVRCNEAARVLLGGVEPGVNLFESHWRGDLQIEGPEGETLGPEEWPLAHAAMGEDFTGREVIVRRSESKPRFVSVDGRPVLDSKGDVALGVTVIHDVTAAREMDQLKDEFLSLAAHELKTPLTSLKGYAQMLLSSSGESLGEGRRRALEVMDKQVDRVNQMVEQFLLVEEIRSGRITLRPEHVDLTDAVVSACHRAIRMANGRTVEYHVPEPVQVRADARSLELVLSNLLDNAMKFSPQGSAVDVSVSVEGGEAIVCVRDGGVGIAREKQGYVFDRFYQVQPGIQRGVGLGLYISQELVSGHGGRMWLESEEGQGSRFYFALPVLVEAQRVASGS